ncbi:MAG TPA: VCBS repeat-containing protein, partial [Gemmata sp.]|nr:VCBS repeat-containing protein [Gemmata sp.]
MPRPTRRHRNLTVELLEDRITPTITFAPFGPDFATGADPRSIAEGDLTGNGITDVAVGADSEVDIFLGDGHGNFTPDVNVLSFGAATNLFLVDLTGNGKLDLVGADGINGELCVAMGNGDGTFQPTKRWTATKGIQSMAIGDLNGDGLPDVVIGYPSGVGVFLNDGTGNIFANPTYYPAPKQQSGDSFFSIVVGDFNGDGHPDVAAGDYDGNAVDVFLNKGNGTLGIAIVYKNPIPNGTADLVAGDFNNDGKLDLVAAYINSSKIGLLLGNGNGTFKAPTLIKTPVQVSAQANSDYVAADFDQNGNLDLLLSSPGYSSGNAFILPGKGNGTFGAPITVDGVGDSAGILVGDFSGDGLLDLGNAVNTESGGFRVAINTSPDAAISSFAVSAPADVNPG